MSKVNNESNLTKRTGKSNSRMMNRNTYGNKMTKVRQSNGFVSIKGIEIK